MIRALVPALLVLVAPALAGAQAPELQPTREALASYDLEGDRTIAALRDLARLSGELHGPAQEEARFLRAAVAVDLWVAATVDPARAALRQRACDAIGAPSDGVAEHLQGELRAVARGAYRGPALETAGALTAALAIDGGSPGAARDARGVRGALLLLAAASRDVAAIARDGRCARGCTAPWSTLDREARLGLDAIVAVSEAAERVRRAVAEGDPLARALADVVLPAAERITSPVIRAAPVVPESFGIDAAPADGAPLRADLVIVVGPSSVRIARAPSYAVRAGQVVPTASGEDVLPAAIAVGLPTELRPVIVPIDEIASALAAREGAVIALAATADAPAHVIARVLASAQRASRVPAFLARRAPDGTLRGAPLAIVDRDEIGVAGDVVIRVRMGGYGVARARGREQSVPRVRGADGQLGFDLAGLAASVERGPRRRTILDPMASMPAHDVLDVAFRVAREGAPITIPL